MKKILLLTTVFINGVGILVLEIMGSKVFTPFYGSTIFVWSALIVTTMLSLAAGYYYGGWVADRSKDRLSNLYSHVFYSGIFIVLIPNIVPIALTYSNNMGIKIGPLISSLMIFSFPMFFMSTVSPIAIKEATTDLGTLGVNSGTIYSIATIGSLFGAIITGYFLTARFFASSVFYMLGFLLIVNYLVSIWIKR
jgi:hypothetical protein